MADHEALMKLATAVVNDLIAASKAVATAESCTGGWVAKAITDVPGSSACFGYGVVSYSDRKSTRLNSSHSQQSRMPSSA